MKSPLPPRVTVVSLPHFCSSHDSGSNQLGPIYGHTSVTTGSLLDDHHWHSVVIERQGRSINLTLDRGVQHFRTNGEFDYLDLDYEVSASTWPWREGPGGCRRPPRLCRETVRHVAANATRFRLRGSLIVQLQGPIYSRCHFIRF